MDESNSHHLRILIVEDDRVTARDLEATLLRRGFLVAGIAHSGEEALALAESEHPEIALLDVRLDNADSGVQLALDLRERFNVPVVFVTGYSEEALFEQVRGARPVGFIRKPFSDAELAACLEAAAERDLASSNLSQRLPGLEAVADHVSQGIIATDLDGVVHYLNEAAAKLTGWGRREAVGMALGDIAPLREKEEEGAAPPTETAEVRNLPRPRVLTLKTRLEEEVEVEERSAPIKSRDGEVVGLVTILSRRRPAIPPGPGAAPGIPGNPPENGDELDSDHEVALPDSGSEHATPPARSAAIKQLREMAQNPAFQKLLAKRPPPSANAAKAPEPPGSTDPVASEVAEVAEPVFAAAGSTLINDLGEPLIRIDDGGKITYANSEAGAVFSGGKSLLGLTFWDRFSPVEFDQYDEAFRRPLADGRRHRFEFHDSKRGLWFEVRAYPTQGGMLALFSDITANKLEVAENVRQQRLEGLGLLARGFAHDFNNELTTITGNISLVMERKPEDADLQQMLSEAQTAATRATGLVQQLMTFARGGRPIRKRTRIPDLIRRILTDQRIQHPEIRYQFQGAEIDLVANVDPAQISRLVENLVSNSTTAMNEGGVLIVRCARITPEEVLHVKDSHTPAEEDHLLIEVIDTGHGMDEKSLAQVFEPYFTTRKEDNASGIGLTVCESIARAHGGFVQLQSKEGKGTIATFCSPLGKLPGINSNEAYDLPDSPVPVPDYPNFHLSGTEEGSSEAEGGILVGTRILILEDDAPIRRLMAATLRRAGHEVVETKDGRETVAVYRDAMEQGAKFHLLICDLTIENGMGGVETMRQLTQLDPAILAIVSSGYSDAPAMSSPASFGFKGVLPKPYAPSELRAAVHRILTAHRVIS